MLLTAVACRFEASDVCSLRVVTVRHRLWGLDAVLPVSRDHVPFVLHYKVCPLGSDGHCVPGPHTHRGQSLVVRIVFTSSSRRILKRSWILQVFCAAHSEVLMEWLNSFLSFVVDFFEVGACMACADPWQSPYVVHVGQVVLRLLWLACWASNWLLHFLVLVEAEAVVLHLNVHWWIDHVQVSPWCVKFATVVIG